MAGAQVQDRLTQSPALFALLCWVVSWRSNGGSTRDSPPWEGDRAQGLTGTFCIILNLPAGSQPGDIRVGEGLTLYWGSVGGGKQCRGHEGLASGSVYTRPWEGSLLGQPGLPSRPPPSNHILPIKF